MLEFRFGVESVGRSSVTVRVAMIIRDGKTGREAQSFDGTVVMVCVDDAGEPVPVEA